MFKVYQLIGQNPHSLYNDYKRKMQISTSLTFNDKSFKSLMDEF